jgi:hypothetical protein
MRKNLVSNVLRTSAFATACLALAGPNVLATSTMSPAAEPQQPVPVAISQTYSSGGTILGTGISSPDGSSPTNVISFTPVVSGAFTSPSAVSLGQFSVSTLPTGKETDYKDTPFTITYNPVTFNLTNYDKSSAPITITGTLTGAITGSQSSVVATFDKITSPAFASPDGASLSTVTVLNSPLALVAPSAGGITTVQGHVDTTSPSPAGTGGSNVPEPTTLAILATALVGLGLRKKLRKARQVD